jgi:hypothetical protein
MTWKEAPEASTYEVQWRSDAHSSWETASTTLKSTAVRKKNLPVGVAHYFRVKPSGMTSGGEPTGAILRTAYVCLYVCMFVWCCVSLSLVRLCFFYAHAAMVWLCFDIPETACMYAYCKCFVTYCSNYCLSCLQLLSFMPATPV